MNIKDKVNLLGSEQRLLGQLIYRNHNQHSSTELFSWIKALNRNLKLLTTEKVHIVLTKLESAVRNASNTKLSVIDLKDVYVAHSMAHAGINLVSVCLDYCCKCSDCVRRLLGKKVFLPLYSMLLAISSRIFHCIKALHDHLYIQASALTTQLKHLELIQPRLAKSICDYMNQAAGTEASSSRFSELTLSLHERLHTPILVSTTATAEDTCMYSSNPSNLTNSRNISCASMIGRDSQKSLVGLDVQEDDTEDAGLLIGDAFIESACNTTTTTTRLPLSIESMDGSRNIAVESMSAREQQPAPTSSEYDALFLAHVPQPSSATQPPPSSSSDQHAEGKKGSKRSLQETVATAGTDLLQVSKLTKTCSSSSSKSKEKGISSTSKKLKTNSIGVSGSADKEKKSKKKSRDKGNTGDAIDDIFGF